MSRKSREKRRSRKYLEYILAMRAARRLLGNDKIIPIEVDWQWYNKDWDRK